MSEGTVYFFHQSPRLVVFSYGESKQQIIDALEAYVAYRKKKKGQDYQSKVIVPKPEQIQTIDKIYLQWAHPIYSLKDFITVDLGDDVKFDVNANIYMQVKKLFEADTPSDAAFGDLYFYNTGFGFHGLPKTVVKKAKKYEWEQHIKEVKKRLLERQNVFLGAVLEGKHFDASVLGGPLEEDSVSLQQLLMKKEQTHKD